jgi:hypothetical protein
MAVQHVYSNAVADGTATSVVRPSDWNSYHNQYLTISGNTAGQSTVSGTNIVLQGGNNVTLSAATAAGAATIIVSGGNTSQFLTTAMQSNAGSNFVAATGVVNGTNITGTVDSNGLSLSVANPGGGAAQTYSHYMPFPTANNSSFFSMGQNNVYMQNVIPDNNYAVSNVEMMFSLAYTSTSNARTNAHTIRYGLYQFGTGASSDSIQSIATSSIYIGMSNTSNNSAGFTVGNSAASFTTSSAGSNIFSASQFYGQKYLYLPFTTTLQAGKEYFFAMHDSSASTGASGGLGVNMYIQTVATLSAAWGELKFSTAATNATNNWEEYDGIVYSVTSNGLMSAADKSAFSQLTNKGRMWMIFENEP